MKVFVAGATGVVGRRAVRELVAEGHDVTAVARTTVKAALVEGLGARAVTVDLFDLAALEHAVAGHDAAVNLATHIPSMTRAASPGAWSENDRIRTDGARNLVDAALAAGVTRYVQESITFTYPDCGDDWIDEDVSIDPSPFVAAVLDAEGHAARFTREGGPDAAGVILRFAMFYAPDARHTRDILRLTRTGMAAGLGRVDAYQSMIHADDAATAVVAALRAPAGVYNIADDEPMTRADSAAALAAAVGRKRLRVPPFVLTRLAGQKGDTLARSQRVSNRRFKHATGWRPRFSSVRAGWPVVVGEAGVAVRPPPGSLARRLAFAYLLSGGMTVGVWATFAPRSFYDSFPGMGRVWVAVDGPFNEHLARDVGGLYLALVVLTVVALLTVRPGLVRTAGVAWLAFSVPHLLYHVDHRDIYEVGDRLLSLGSLTATVVVAAALVLWPGRA